jgi:hypothetical protein
VRAPAITHPISTYRLIQLRRQVLDQVATAVASGAMPMLLGHDISRPVAVADVQTGIEQLNDDHFAVWAEFDVDADVWAAHESVVVAAGAPGGCQSPSPVRWRAGPSQATLHWSSRRTVITSTTMTSTTLSLSSDVSASTLAARCSTR